MVKYLGELEDDDLVMFVLEHLKDHKGPHKLVDGLEPVRTFSYSANQHLLTNISHSGARRRGYGTRYLSLATSYLREHVLR